MIRRFHRFSFVTIAPVRAFVSRLARIREESDVPSALAPDDRVVCAPSDQYRTAPTRGGLRACTSLISQERRKLAQTASGVLALNNCRDLDTRNELCGGGPSGTTGTLLAAGWAFGSLTGDLQR